MDGAEYENDGDDATVVLVATHDGGPMLAAAC
jgi:hypothetical protein